ncbi:MAG: DUF1565 domain-containing protein [Terriglobales bacterium]
MKFISPKVVHQVFLFFFLLAGSLALAGTAMAQNNYYVNASTGSDSNDGSQARPWKTIQRADSALSLGSGGAIVHVGPGTYSGPSTSKSGTSSARIVFISDTKWKAKIANSSWQAGGDYVDINGFEFTNPGSGGYAVNIASAKSVHILNNYMHDFNVSGCGPYGIINETNNPISDSVISGNVIRHAGNYNPTSGPTAVHCVELHGIYSEGKNTIIQNNIISGITGWGIKRNMAPGACGPGVISNNTVFNNGGGIDLTEDSDAGFVCAWDYNSLTNNVIVNNGVDTPGGGRFGINFYHVTGTHNLVANNLIYGNKPSDYAHHDVACAGGTPISGSDANGTAGGCPSTNPKSDPSSSITFVSFQFDGNTAPASNYNADNYQIKAGSSAIQNGTTSCASSPGISPCVPAVDFVGVARLTGSTVDIGAYEQGSSSATGVPAAPTGLTAQVQ